jgi:regulator of sigma E protease
MMMTYAMALPVLDGIGRIAVFLLVLSILVVLHEFGHFILARLNGVRVNDFAVGFGPTLLKWTSPRSGTNYRLNLFPIGGYCAMQGEDGRTSEAQQQREFRAETNHSSDNFQSKTPLQRLAIIAAGPLANFIVAFFVLVFGALLFGAPSESRMSTVIGPLEHGSPGARAGLQIGDRIVAIDGVPMHDGTQMANRIHGSSGEPLDLTIARGSQTLHVHVTPELRKIEGKNVRIIGFTMQQSYERVGPITAVSTGTQRFVEMLTTNVIGLGSLIVHPKTAASQISGPVGIGAFATQAQALGWGPYLQLVAAISMALGIFNFLPIPALDGGRGVFIIAEMLRGRPVDPEKEALVHVTGFALLMVLMLFVAYHDITNIVTSRPL